MNDEEFVFRKLFKIEIQKIGPINSDHAQNRFPQKLGRQFLEISGL